MHTMIGTLLEGVSPYPIQQYRIHNNNNRAPTEGMQNNMHSYPAEFCSCALCNSESLKIGYIMYHDISDVVKS